MQLRKFSFPLFFSALTLLLVALIGQPVAAQCGTQASSCKNCHEVQGQDPVNNDGTSWHESHAFGDFCYICHAGNQQATDETEAHTGMVPPLSDIQASCQMCHATDLNERAEVYAVALGIDLNSAGSDAATPTSAPSSDDFWGSGGDSSASVEPTAVPVSNDESQTTSSTNTSFSSQELVVDDASMVDYTQRYNEIVLGQRPVNWGNVALAGLIGLLVLGGGGFVIVNEIRLNTTLGETRPVEGEYPADVVEMLPVLAALKINTRRALRRILANPQKADQVLNLIDTVVSDEDTEEHAQ
jgi:hypothetical protein